MPYDPMMSDIDNKIAYLEEEIEFLENFLVTSGSEYYVTWVRLIAKCKNELERQKFEKQRHQNHNKERGIKY